MIHVIGGKLLTLWAPDLRTIGGTTMLMKTCIAAAVALGCVLVVPGASFAADDKDKSATSTTQKPKAAAHKSHKKPKKGYSDDVHNR
jgi:hypothetical protein